jgi:hypothetical protein
MRNLDRTCDAHVIFGVRVDDVSTAGDQEGRLGLQPAHVLADQQRGSEALSQTLVPLDGTAGVTVGVFVPEVPGLIGKRCSAISTSGWVIGLPIPRHELIDALLRPAVDETCQQIREVGLWINAIEFASLDQ